MELCTFVALIAFTHLGRLSKIFCSVSVKFFGHSANIIFLRSGTDVGCVDLAHNWHSCSSQKVFSRVEARVL